MPSFGVAFLRLRGRAVGLLAGFIGAGVYALPDGRLAELAQPLGRFWPNSAASGSSYGM